MPLRDLAIRKGSSPDSSGERKTVWPSLTNGPEVFFPLYPLLRMATGIPLSINPFARAITKRSLSGSTHRDIAHTDDRTGKAFGILAGRIL